jgi:hypothetical protein
MGAMRDRQGLLIERSRADSSRDESTLCGVRILPDRQLVEEYGSVAVHPGEVIGA